LLQTLILSGFLTIFVVKCRAQISHLFALVRTYSQKDITMSVRKRTWLNANGSKGQAWVAEYTDHEGKRRLRTFETKQQADSFHVGVTGELRAGTHVPDSQSVTVAEAGRLWLNRCEADGLEQSTVDYYQQHLDRHIIPVIGMVKLSRLTMPMLTTFQDKLRELGRSPTMVRKVRISLGALLADAQRRGLVGQNVVHALPRSLRGKEARAAARQKGKLRVGVDIPSLDEIRAIIAAASDGRRPLLLTAIFTGLRISELRGLRWDDVDLKRSELHVRQRADRYNAIGKPKSVAGERVIPLPPTLISTLRKWRLACPNSELGLAFPAADGSVESYVNITRHALVPTLLAAGVTSPVKDEHGKPAKDEDGKPIIAAKYGWHSLRHFYASWCINRRVDGGLELPLKLVQARLGHASVQMTADRYGHLFPSGDDGAELAAAERAFLG
jgi:integrase